MSVHKQEKRQPPMSVTREAALLAELSHVRALLAMGAEEVASLDLELERGFSAELEAKLSVGCGPRVRASD